MMLARDKSCRMKQDERDEEEEGRGEEKEKEETVLKLLKNGAGCIKNGGVCIQGLHRLDTSHTSGKPCESCLSQGSPTTSPIHGRRSLSCFSNPISRQTDSTNTQQAVLPLLVQYKL